MKRSIESYGRTNQEEDGRGAPKEVREISEAWLFIVLVPVLLGILFLVCCPCVTTGASREKVRRISCCSNLKQIGLAIRMYAQDYNGEFPDRNGAAGLEMLRSMGYLENTRMYTCPSTTDTINEGCEITDANCSYVYRAGLNEKSSVDSGVCWDKPNDHTKFGNILFADGHVQGFAGSTWQLNAKANY